MKKRQIFRQIPAFQLNLFSVYFLIRTLLLTSCNSRSSSSSYSAKVSTDNINLSETQNAHLDSIVHFLLNVSARDFYDHQPPTPVSFRDVKVRNIVGPDGENHYMICGQFLDKDKQNKDDWTSFATIKTSGYEQWIGNQSLSYCQDSKAVSYRINELSSELKSRFDSLQNKAK